MVVRKTRADPPLGVGMDNNWLTLWAVQIWAFRVPACQGIVSGRY
jgi:hypothetical protein